MAVQHEIAIRWADLDLMGHVNNVRAMEFLQEARIALIAELGYAITADSAGVTFEGVGQVIARHEVDYAAPILHSHGHVVVESWLEHIGRSSYTIVHVVTLPDATIAIRSRATMVCTDPTTGRSTPIPELWRASLEAHLIPTATATATA
ncbi:MAG: thioesterase family protein [Actinomycetes bacterium]